MNPEFKKWFPAYKPVQGKANLRILCFPNAGSAENIYTGPMVQDRKRVPNKLIQWASEAKAEVLAVQMPGREARRSEPFLGSCEEVARRLLPVIRHLLEDGTPYVIIAHSLGNWVSYEFMKLVRAEKLPLPQMKFASCMAAPNIDDNLKPWRPNKDMTEAQLQEECILWDINRVVLQPDMWKIFQPLLRADFSLFDTYHYKEQDFEEFDFPIHAFFALQDKKITREMVEGWQAFTTGDFSLEVVKGNHLFVYDHAVREEWFETITDVLVGEGF